jgi:hypothetical protein
MTRQKQAEPAVCLPDLLFSLEDEGACFSEMSVNFYQATGHIP